MNLSWNRNFMFALVAVLILPFLSGCEEGTTSSYSNPSPNPQPQVQSNELRTSNDDVFGQFLITEEGTTLYFFAPDVTGSATCEGGCAQNWPPFYREDLQAGSGLDQVNIGVITRTDGSKQNTFKGWPLYAFAGDASVGEINGDGLGGNWFVAKPDYDVMVAQQEIDGNTVRYLVNGSGRTLYYFTSDGPDQSNCSGGCLENWPPFGAENVTAPSTVAEDKFDSIERIEGGYSSNQTTFDSRPLYYFEQDIERGLIKGQAINNAWFVINETLFAK